MRTKELEIRPAGDSGVAVYLGATIDISLNRAVHAQAARVADALTRDGRVEVIPGYASYLVHYDPVQNSYEHIVSVIREAAEGESSPTHEPRRFVLPTLYGGEFGPDLVAVAEYHGITPDEVIGLHTDRDYPIFCLGFSPGFPLCGGLPVELHTPRLETPRPRVPAGSVAIAGGQTGIYPTNTPGGWRLLGRCPLVLFDLNQSPPVAYRAEDVVRFEAIDADEYARLQQLPRMPEGEWIGHD